VKSRKILEVIPERDITLPDSVGYPDLRALATAACNTINLLAQHGYELGETIPDDDKVATKMLKEYAEDSRKKISYEEMLANRPEAIVRTADIIKKFDYAMVKEAKQLRMLVINKLILETESANANIRIKALELIGKMADVGLFSERKELTVIHRNPEEIRDKLKERLDRMKTLVKDENGVYQ
jgi:hypothetical protein